MLHRWSAISLALALLPACDAPSDAAADKDEDKGGEKEPKAKGDAARGPGAGDDAGKHDEPQQGTPGKEPAAGAAQGGLDIAGGNAEVLCKQLMPDDIYALGVDERWSKDRKLVAKKTYGGKRVRCHWEGADPSAPSPKAFPYFEVEVGCGEKDPAGLCKSKLDDQAIKKIEVIDEAIEGTQCHTLSAQSGGNWIVMPDGCYVILYKASPNIMGVDQAERDKRRADTTFAVGKAVVAKILASSANAK